MGVLNAGTHADRAKQKIASSLAKHCWRREFYSTRTYDLLKRAADLRKDVIRVRSDQAHCAHYDYENDCQHHRVFGDILTVFLGPQLLQPCERTIAVFL